MKAGFNQQVKMEARKRKCALYSVDVVEKKSRVGVSLEEAVIKMQRTYTRHLAMRVKKFGFFLFSGERVGWECMSPALRDERLIKLVGRMVRRVCALTWEGVNECGKDWPGIAHIVTELRVFLVSFLIVFHPRRSFDEMMLRQKAVLKAAVDMHKVFEGLVCALCDASSDPVVAVREAQTFPKLLCAYRAVWAAWKEGDEWKIRGRIEHELMALSEAEALLDEDGEESVAMHNDFHEQRRSLCCRLQTVCGERAVAEVLNSSALKSSMRASVRYGFNWMRRSTHAGGKLEQVVSEHEKYWLQLLSTTNCSLLRTAFTVPRVIREEAVHAVLLDAAFQSDETVAGTLMQRKTREVFRKYFWKSITADLRLSCYGRIFDILRALLSGVNIVMDSNCTARSRGHISRARREMCARLREVLDVEFIRGRVENGSFTWDSCLELVTGVQRIFADIEAYFRLKLQNARQKVRDNHTSVLRWRDVHTAMQAARDNPAAQPEAFSKALEHLLHYRLVHIVFDESNLSLAKLKPLIVIDGIDFLRDKFQRKLNAGTVSLKRTKEWLQRVVYEEVTSGRVALDKLKSRVHSQRRGCYDAILQAGHVKLLSGATALYAWEYPETLVLDAERFGAMHVDLRKATYMLSVLSFVGKHLVDAKARTAVLFLEKVGRRLLDGASTDEAVDVLYTCEELGGSDFENLRNVLRQQTKHECAVPQMMQQRLYNLLRCCDFKNKDVFSTDMGAHCDYRLPVVAKSIKSFVFGLVERLHVVEKHNVKVHHMTYYRLIMNIVANLYP